MFNAELCAEVTQSLPEFGLAKPCNALGSLSHALHSYLEFYGYYETLKEVPADFYWGYRTCTAAHHTYRIATFYWKPPSARGTVFLVHGLFDHVGLFQHLIRHFLKSGYAVVAVDLPGHGLSSGLPTAIADFHYYSQVIADTHGFFSGHCKAPCYGVGQSTGAAVLMDLAFKGAAKQQPPDFERLVLLGPLVRPRQWWLGRLAFLALGGFVQHVQRDFANANSHDEEFCNFLRNHDPLQARQLSVSWVAALNRWINDFDHQPTVDVPTLIVQGTQDRVVDWRYNLQKIQQHFSCVQVNMVEGARHHLANEAEPWRQAIYGGVSQFFRSRSVCSTG